MSRAGKCRHFSAVEKFSQGKNFDRLSFFDLFWITHASVYKAIGKIIKENSITFFFSEAEIIWWELFIPSPSASKSPAEEEKWVCFAVNRMLNERCSRFLLTGS